jgi:hypothetical protein
MWRYEHCVDFGFAYANACVTPACRCELSTYACVLHLGGKSVVGFQR